MNKTAEARHSHGDHAVAESPDDSVVSPTLTHEAYKAELRLLQIELVKLQRHFIGCGDKILSRVHYAGKKSTLVKPDFNIAFEFTPDCIDSKRLAR